MLENLDTNVIRLAHLVRRRNRERGAVDAEIMAQYDHAIGILENRIADQVAAQMDIDNYSEITAFFDEVT